MMQLAISYMVSFFLITNLEAVSENHITNLFFPFCWLAMIGQSQSYDLWLIRMRVYSPQFGHFWACHQINTLKTMSLHTKNTVCSL